MILMDKNTWDGDSILLYEDQAQSQLCFIVTETILSYLVLTTSSSPLQTTPLFSAAIPAPSTTCVNNNDTVTGRYSQPNIYPPMAHLLLLRTKCKSSCLGTLLNDGTLKRQILSLQLHVHPCLCSDVRPIFLIYFRAHAITLRDSILVAARVGSSHETVSSQM